MAFTIYYILLIKRLSAFRSASDCKIIATTDCSASRGSGTSATLL